VKVPEQSSVEEIDKKILALEDEVARLRKIAGQMRRVRQFWGNVEKTETCWNWMGKLYDGYGSLAWNGKAVGPHRVAYELMVGKINPTLVIDHICPKDSLQERARILSGKYIPHSSI
jgi:hypothetical protein